MRRNDRLAFVQFAALALLLSFASSTHAQIAGGTDRNTSKRSGADSECAIAKNPTNNLQLFVSCNETSTGGLFAARSVDGGLTWTYPDPADKTLADGDAGQGALACCDPSLAWDTFGNLYLTYLDSTAANVVALLSTDGGLTFAPLVTFPGSVDQQTVVAANTSAPGAPVAVWLVWNSSGSMRASGAAVTGLGAVGAFGAAQVIPGTSNCSFGDIAIAPSGVVVQVCQSPTGGEGPGTLRVNTDVDGLGAGNFGAVVNATTTNVGGFDFIPAQNSRSVDSEAGLAYDANPASPHFGRLYLVYTEEVVPENHDLDIMLRFSDDDGATWSNPPIRVNNDPAGRSQFLPKIASNPLSGNIAVCWHDARNSASNTAMQVFCSIATPTGMTPTFIPNGQVGDGASTSNGTGVEFGDYSGLAYFQGIVHPVWGDTSNSTADNPQGTGNFDAYTDRVTGGAAANEGDPHMTTIDGVHYDFQSAGEFVMLREHGGMEIQTRQTAIPTTFFPGPDDYTGLATCVAINSAVAARVGRHRVTFQPNISGVPDPSGMQLRVDGKLTTLGPDGIALGDGGRVARSGSGGGIEVDFPNGTSMIVTPGWWASQSKWYLNVNVTRTPALEGVMGAIVPGSWLPMLPDGTSLGPKPADLDERYTQLYERFEEAWRVTDNTTLFDYGPGTSTESFTMREWPPRKAPCELPGVEPARPLSRAEAERACRGIEDKERREDCIFDVTVTGHRGFAETYRLTERLLAGATTTTVIAETAKPGRGEAVVLTALVERRVQGRRRGAPAGTVQFLVDGEKAGAPVKLDRTGRAVWRTSRIGAGAHRVSARYTPAKGSAFLSSSSAETPHAVPRTTMVKE